MKRVLVTGGAGYLGHRLMPELLQRGYAVTVLDTLWFGWNTAMHPNLLIVEGDIRNGAVVDLALRDVDYVIHLACISNDPSAELDESLTRTINYEAFAPLVAAARRKEQVARFIYLSSSSVYGISDAPDVREDHPLVPITLYNTYKAACEPELWAHGGDMCCTILRPSTLCGYSPRQRLDLAVNILTNLAVNKGEITVFGGQQKRPNLHVDDMVDALIRVLEAPQTMMDRQIFNVGAWNMTILGLAHLVRNIVAEMFPSRPTPNIVVQDSVDPRSYQVNSDKFRIALGWQPRHTIADAVRDLCFAFRKGWLPNPLTDDRYYNVKRMRNVWEGLYKNAPPSTFDPTKGHLSEIDLIRARTSVVS